LKEQVLIMIATPVYMIVIGLEALFSHLRAQKYYTLKETLMNVYLSLANAGIDLLFRWVYAGIILTWFYSFRVLDLSPHPFVYWLLLFVLEDFVFYIEHRVDHYCRLFWAVHVTHHSSREFNLTTGFRSSVLQPLYRFVYFIPLALLGFAPVDILFMYSLTQIYGILVHTQAIKKMPRWFELFFVSPSHHRVHHASNAIYIDKNMGMCLIIWDKWFGTFQAELPDHPVQYGLAKTVSDLHHPLKIIFHEWQSIGKDISQQLPFITRLKYVFMPPGWSHDGSSKTSRQVRQEGKKTII
jgi:sterol desaturase/sphingolipid hydroxylase (fatty acid hydroxylase superfamily)